MKILFTLLFSICLLSAYAQTMAGFENFELKPGEHLNNAAPERGFESGSIVLPNVYNQEFNFWSGFAVSADTNTTTPGFTNQYSAYPGEGALGTSAYAMGYIYEPLIINLKEQALGKPMIGMYVTNSTYAYLSMRDGDSFAKKFGGETGKDPDFYFLTVKKYSGGAISDDSINVYLADYRSSDPTKDYIVKDWKYVDLTVLGEVDSLILILRSSDVGVFGMNTPSYVAIDEVSTDNLLSASGLFTAGKQISYGPNPARDVLYVNSPGKGECSIANIQGAVLWTRSLEEGYHEIALSHYPQGLYFISWNGQISGKFCID